MNKKELFLHIGMPKTATTTLQHFFARNRKILQSNGVTYPLSGNQNAHHRLGWSINIQSGLNSWRMAPDLQDYKEEWGSVLAQLKSGKNLLSTESVWGFSNDQIAIVKEMTSQFHTRIVIYIRRQDTLIDSWYNELVKIGIIRKAPASNNRILSLEPLERWTKFFGTDNIIVRPYEKQQFHHGTIFSDFLHHILGIEPTDEFVLPENGKNPSLHRIALEYKRMVNFLPLSPQEKSALQQPLLTASVMLSEKGLKTYPVFSPQKRLQLYDDYSQTYETIARRYLKRKNGRLFYDDSPDLSKEWHSYDELKQGDAQITNEFLGSHYPDQLAIIVKGILHAQFCQERESRLAAYKLLPGIPPACISQVLTAMLETPNHTQRILPDDQLGTIYASPIWKAGRVVNHVLQRLPKVLKKTALKIINRLCQQNR